MKTPKHKGASAPQRPTTRANLSLDATAYQRLMVTAVMSNRSAGDLVTELIEQHLRTWALPANLVARNTRNDRPGVPDPVSVSGNQHAQADAA